MHWPKKVLVVYNSKPSSTSGRLFTKLANVIRKHTACQIDNNPDPNLSFKSLASTLLANLARVVKVIRADVLVLHSYLIFSLPSLLLARFVGTRVVVFQWDVYPTTLNGYPLNHSPVRARIDWIEARLLRLANTVIVPSSDFVPFVKHDDIRIMPIWSTSDQTEVTEDGSIENVKDGPWRLCFAGQVTPLRGLSLAIEHILASTAQTFELHIFSGDLIPEELAMDDRICVKHHGFLQSEKLIEEMSKMHFGLISLHPEMDQPGFPSKTFDFVAAGLPVLFFGPSMPAFTDLLKTCGVGCEISDLVTFDLAVLHRSLTATFPEARDSFLEQTMLNPNRLRDILALHSNL